MQLFIASDHGGFELKNSLKQFIEEIFGDKFRVRDIGPYELNPLDSYADYARKLSEKLLSENGIGILICRSGIGMSIAANKYKGIYAALCFTPEHAIKAREHNNSNVLCLDSDYGDLETHKKIVENFLLAEFNEKETRHLSRVSEIKSIEEKNFV